MVDPISIGTIPFFQKLMANSFIFFSIVVFCETSTSILLSVVLRVERVKFRHHEVLEQNP